MCLSRFLCFNGVCGFRVYNILVDYMFQVYVFVMFHYKVYVFVSTPCQNMFFTTGLIQL